jgi:hypothetical protein
MVAETEVLLLCANQRMTSRSVERVGALCRAADFSWAALSGASSYHRIGALVLTNLLKIDGLAERMTPAIRERWKQLRARNILTKKNREKTLGQVVDFFAARSARVMLVKGAAMDAAVYDEPWYIQSDDVDIIADIANPKLAGADRALLAKLLKRGHIELEFTRHHDLDMNRVLDIDYPRLWAEARPVKYGTGVAYIMAPEDMLLAACINLCRKRYQQLRGMMAIRELTQKYQPVAWEKLAQNALACGASRIVYTALTITRHLLGCAPPQAALDALRLGLGRRWAIDRLSLAVSTSLLHIPQPPRELARRLITSGLLRAASYHLTQFWREARAHYHFRLFLAKSSPKPLCAVS